MASLATRISLLLLACDADDGELRGLYIFFVDGNQLLWSVVTARASTRGSPWVGSGFTFPRICSDN